MVWQTRVERDDGRLVAVVTQTQIVLPRDREPGEQLAALFADQEPAARRACAGKLARADCDRESHRRQGRVGGPRFTPDYCLEGPRDALSGAPVRDSIDIADTLVRRNTAGEGNPCEDTISVASILEAFDPRIESHYFSF
jgi:hypothetical protein